MIERADDGDVAVLRLAHGRVNAIDLELCAAITEQFRALATDSARAVVLTGAGTTFCAGVGPAALPRRRRCVRAGAPARARRGVPGGVRADQAARVRGERPRHRRWLRARRHGRRHADGAGRRPDRDPRDQGRRAVPAGAAGDRPACRRCGGGPAARDGRADLRAEDARAIGLVDHVVPADELLRRAVGTAHALATDVPSDTFAITKAQLRRESLERITRYADEDDTATLLWSRRATDGWTSRYLESVTRR